jgi:divalent metal cation (Fe/Co/Zn/Cd) transporter
VNAPADTARTALLRQGLLLEYLTLSWNVVGVVILAIATLASGSVALAGFGVDSLIEIVASSVVVWELRGEQGSRRERVALRIIAVAFALLAVYIAVQATVTLAGGSRPHRSTLGVIWLAVTVVAMWALAYGKHRTGTQLQNKVLITEARVTVLDGALAGAVLIGVALNAALGWWWADPLSSLVILVYGVREARHAWQEGG